MKPLAGGAIEDGSLALKFVLNNKNISIAIKDNLNKEKIIENILKKKGK